MPSLRRTSRQLAEIMPNSSHINIIGSFIDVTFDPGTVFDGSAHGNQIINLTSQILHSHITTPIIDSIRNEFNATTDLLSENGNQMSESSESIAASLERDPLSTVIPMTILYGLILVAGIIGNVSTCIVITRNKYMRTATNYYLFSLAVSDLLLLILGLPQEMYMLWRPYPYVFGEFFCVTRGLTSETSTNASVLTITAFTFERFLAICYPLRAHTMSKLNRAVKIIVGIWILAALSAVPLAFQFGLDYMRDKENGSIIEGTASCTLKRPLERSFEISTVVFFVVPMTLILILYLLIGIQLRRSEGLSRERAAAAARCSNTQRDPPPKLANVGRQMSVQSNCSSANSSLISKNGSFSKFKGRRSWEGRHSALHGRPSVAHSASTSSRRAVIKMLIAVVVAFFVCWAPFHAQRLMAIYVTEPTAAEIFIFTILTYFSGVSYYVSATINPILYSIMSLKFRQAFKDTFGRFCCGTSNGNGANGAIEAANMRFGESSMVTRGEGASCEMGRFASERIRRQNHFAASSFSQRRSLIPCELATDCTSLSVSMNVGGNGSGQNLSGLNDGLENISSLKQMLEKRPSLEAAFIELNAAATKRCYFAESANSSVSGYCSAPWSSQETEVLEEEDELEEPFSQGAAEKDECQEK